MRSENTEGITDRKLALDFEEIAGRSNPPDRSAEILMRARELESGDLTFPVVPDEPRGARILPAALLLLGLAATLGIGILSSEPDPLFSPGAQDKGKQDKGKQSAADKNAKKEAQLETEVLLLRKQLQEMLDKVQAVRKGRLQAVKNPLQRLVGLQPQDPKKLAETGRRALALRLLNKGKAEAARAALLAGLVDGSRVAWVSGGNNPLVKGEYSKLLNQFSQAKRKLERTTDPAKARKVIDEITIILTNARRVLWEKEQAAKKAGKSGEAGAAGATSNNGKKVETAKKPNPYNGSGAK